MVGRQASRFRAPDLVVGVVATSAHTTPRREQCSESASGAQAAPNLRPAETTVITSGPVDVIAPDAVIAFDNMLDCGGAG